MTHPRAHQVETHLGVGAEAYDAAIRRFVPHYHAMLRAAVDTTAAALGDGSRRVLVDLGTGTGALTAALAARLPQASLHALDGDPRMLAEARRRLTQFGGRIQYHHGAFLDAIPGGAAAAQPPLPARPDAFVASLALHHVRDLAEKIALYRGLRAALAPSGILVNADAMLAAEEPARARELAAWIAHEVASGITEAAARQNLADWQRDEDRYFSIAEEHGALLAAGFTRVEVAWHRAPMAVLRAS